MEMNGIKSQWWKRCILETNLPAEVYSCMKDLLNKVKSKAGDDIYYKCKTRLLKIYGPKPTENFSKAQALKMTGLPSQAAKQLVDLVCQKDPPLENCCCATAIGKFWRDMLPPMVRAVVSSMDLKEDFEGTLEAADCAFNSMAAGAVVAATTVDATTTNDPGAVAAVSRGTRGASNSRGNRSRGRGTPRTQRNDAETPPPGCCDQHVRYGKKAYYCMQKESCPWKDFVSPPVQKQK